MSVKYYKYKVIHKNIQKSRNLAIKINTLDSRLV